MILSNGAKTGIMLEATLRACRVLAGATRLDNISALLGVEVDSFLDDLAPRTLHGLLLLTLFSHAIVCA